MANTSWNPADKTTDIVLSNLNLTAKVNQFGVQATRTIYGSATGKYYLEYKWDAAANLCCGIANSTFTLATVTNTGATNTAVVNAAGSIFVNNVSTATLSSFANGSTACMALDLDNRLIWFRNGAAGTWNNSGTANPATGVGGSSLTFVGSGVAAYGLMSCASAAGSGQITGNFGDSAFVGVVPAGFASGFPGTAAAGGTTQARAMVLA